MSAAASSGQITSSGAIFDLGAIAAEDDLTVCKPQTTLWSQCWKRHFNFAFAEIDFPVEQTNISGATSWVDNFCVTGISPKHGDLLIGTFVRAFLGGLSIRDGVIARADGTGNFVDGEENLALYWCEEVGNALIKEATWLVDNNVLDKVNDQQMHVYHETMHDDSVLLRESIGRFRNDNGPATNTNASMAFSAVDRYLYIPLPFSYLDSPQNAFPQLAVDNAPITFDLKLRGRQDLIVFLDLTGGITYDQFPNTPATDLWTNPFAVAALQGGSMIQFGMTNQVIFLDAPEQELYKSQTVVQYYEYTQSCKQVSVNQGATSAIFEHLMFNNSIVTLYTYFQSNNAIRPGQLEYFNFCVPTAWNQRPQRFDALGNHIGGIYSELNPLETIQLSLTSAPRVSRQGIYWREIQPFLRLKRRSSSCVNSYSFGRDVYCPDHPSGALNIGLFSCTPLEINFRNVNPSVGPSPAGTVVSNSGLEVGGIVYVFARTQGFYKIAGGKLSTKWLAS
jgi:hypothetical protein